MINIKKNHCLNYITSTPAQMPFQTEQAREQTMLPARTLHGTATKSAGVFNNFQEFGEQNKAQS